MQECCVALDDLESFTVEPWVFSVTAFWQNNPTGKQSLFSFKVLEFSKKQQRYSVSWYCPDQPSDHSFVMKASKHERTHTKSIWFGLRSEVCVCDSPFMSGRECDVWTVGGSGLPSVSKVPSWSENGTRLIRKIIQPLNPHLLYKISPVCFKFEHLPRPMNQIWLLLLWNYLCERDNLDDLTL